MKNATTSERHFENTKLLSFTGRDQIDHSTLDHLVDYFKSGDVLVINHSATLPSSFRGVVERTRDFVEMRLAAFQGPDSAHLENWKAISFGTGDWMQPTEERGPAPVVHVGDRLVFGEDLRAKILDVKEGRLLSVGFESSSLLKNLYKHGRPIQYSYHEKPLEIWDQQTIFSGPPISVEPPSASFQFTWSLVFELQKKGVRLAHLLHSAGISSTGDLHLDHFLPLQEWYEIPEETVNLVQDAQKNGNRVVALGTTVLRALESATKNGQLNPGKGMAEMKITPGYRLQSVNALITGMHEPGSSHMKILDSLCSLSLIEQGYSEAISKGYRGHEYGDVSFLNCGCD